MLLQPESFGDRPLGWHITTTVAQHGIACFGEGLCLMGGTQVHPHQALGDRRPILAGKQNITGSVDGQPDDLVSLDSAYEQTLLYCAHQRVPPVLRVLLCPAWLRIKRCVPL